MRSAIWLFVLHALVVISAVRAVEPIPAPPERQWLPVPEVAGDDAAAGAARFVPMQETGAAVAGSTGRPYVRLPCRFAAVRMQRASWDIPVRCDLALARGLQFWFYCADTTPISGFSVYFHSGDGWYHSRFGVERQGEWQRITVDKRDSTIEGQPGGWGRVDTIRISIWSGRPIDTECAIADIGVVGGNPSVLVIRGDSGASGDEAKAISTFAGNVCQAFDELGVEYGLIADEDADAARLLSRKLLVLPYNPHVPAALGKILDDYVRQGGKLMVFYSISDELAAVLGIERQQWLRPPGGHFGGMQRLGEAVIGQPEFVGQQSWCAQIAKPAGTTGRTVAVWRDADGHATDLPAVVATAHGAYVGHVLLRDDWAAQKQLLLALAGEAVPAIWEKAATGALAEVGQLADCRDYASFRAAFTERQPPNPALQAALADADRLRAAAAASLVGKVWPDAIRQAQAAQAACRTAWCLSQPSQKGEHRAFWCHSAFGLPGMSWDQSIGLLAESGFTAILPNMLWGGVTYAAGETLPSYPDFAQKGDQLRQCLDACRAHGIECHVWKVNWNMGSHTPPAFLARMKAENRIQKSFAGELQEGWLCPSNPANQQLEIDAMVEVARLYPVDGLHFDYIRYPGPDFCFCDGCRGRFESVLGHPVVDWPADVRKDADIATRWLDFRRANITKVVAAVSAQARPLRPGLKISAAVFPNLPTDRDGVGQDWQVWCDKGYVDFVCPMDYTGSTGGFRNLVAAQLTYAGKARCYPGIGLSCWSTPQDVVKLIEQIGVTRTLGAGGFTVFNLDDNAAAVLPLCRLGITSE